MNRQFTMFPDCQKCQSWRRTTDWADICPEHAVRFQSLNRKINQRALNQLSNDVDNLSVEFNQELSLDMSGDCAEQIHQHHQRCLRQLEARHRTAWLLTQSFKADDESTLHGYLPPSYWGYVKWQQHLEAEEWERSQSCPSCSTSDAPCRACA